MVECLSELRGGELDTWLVFEAHEAGKLFHGVEVGAVWSPGAVSGPFLVHAVEAVVHWDPISLDLLVHYSAGPCESQNISIAEKVRDDPQ